MSQFTTIYNFTDYRVYIYAKSLNTKEECLSVKKAGSQLVQSFISPLHILLTQFFFALRDLLTARRSAQQFLFTQTSEVPFYGHLRGLKTFVCSSFAHFHSFLYLQEFKVELLSIKALFPKNKVKQTQITSPHIYKKEKLKEIEQGISVQAVNKVQFQHR